jgi:hypothetical protein
MKRRRVVGVLVPVLFATHCSRPSEPEPGAAAPPASLAAGPAVSARPASFAVAEKRRNVAREDHGARVSTKTGKAGEWLEGDVYGLRLHEVRLCGPEPGGAEAAEADPEIEPPLVFGIRVELKAKAALTVSPRDFQLVSGGFIFYGSMDTKRKPKGCAPVLEHTRLKEGETLQAYLLVDVPPPEPPNLTLDYQPTRWGGATPTRIPLECLTCAAAPAARPSASR